MGIDTGTLIALLGWAVTGLGWYVSQRSQRKAFLYQVMNTARGEIIRGWRARQDVVMDLAITTLMIATEHRAGRTADWAEAKWSEQFHKYQAVIAREDSQWLFVLEQYQVLFPETEHCRRQFVERLRTLTPDIGNFFVDLLTPAQRENALGRANLLHDRLMDESALVEDMLVHIQNVTLGKIVGKTVSFRTPLNANLPRIVMKSGRLEIVEGKA